MEHSEADEGVARPSQQSPEAQQWREKQYATLAEIGLLALRQVDIDQVLLVAAQRLLQALDADYTKVLDRHAGATGLLLRAGSGWPDGVVGNREVPEGAQSQGGYTILSGRPVIVVDLPAETRFEPPELLVEHGVRSGVSVLIEAGGRIFGVLEADKRQPGFFSQAHVPILQAYANVLGAAIAQHERERVSAEFAVLAAHELRTPLTTIIGFGSRLLGQLDDDGTIGEDQREEIEAVYAESLRLRRSVELFLGLGDAERRMVPLALADVDLVDLATEVAIAVEERFPGRRIRVVPGESEVIFTTDEVSVARILTNLVENAVKYSPERSIVAISVATSDTGFDLVVSDACGGIAADDMRRMFQWSYQGDESKDDDHGGQGLGLYVAQRLSERVGATLDAENVGDGCAFTVHLRADPKAV